MSIVFDDRRDAGRQLATALVSYAGRTDLLVLALPRGGVPVGAEVARALGAPLDVLVVRKLGHPAHPEFAIGAIGPGGMRVVGEQAIEWPVPHNALDAVVRREQAELQRRERLYRGGRAAPSITGRTLIVVDDGLATGATMQAAVRAARKQQPARLAVAVPVASREAVALLQRDADEVLSLSVPASFRAVGCWYRDFDQTGDEEVLRLLSAAALAAP